MLLPLIPLLTLAAPFVFSSQVLPLIQDDAVWGQADLERVSKEILVDIEKIRGDDYTRKVKVTTSDNAGFVDYVTERMEQTTTEDQLWSDEIVMKMLGLVDPEMDYLATQMELLESQVGGFYDPGTESFCLMESFTGSLAKIILAHELTHALDDQLFDIDGTLESMKGNADAQLAYHAVVEGSGTSTMNEWLVANMANLDMSAIANSSAIDMSMMEEAPAAMWKPMLMVYMRGAAFLKRTDDVGLGQIGKIDRADLERAFTNPPTSTEQILHPEKYWDKEQLDEPMKISLDTSALQKEGWRLITEETLGEGIIALATSEADERGGLNASNVFALLGTKYTNKAAAGWGGDRYVLMKKGDSIFFHLATKWDTEDDAKEFYENIQAQSAALTGAHKQMSDLAATTSRLSRTDSSVSFSVQLGGEMGGLPALIRSVK